MGPNRHRLINRNPTPLQKILQQANSNNVGSSNKIVPEPGWIPVTKFDLPKVPLGAAGRPIPQTLQQKNKNHPPQEIVQQVILRNKLEQQNRLEALLKKTKLPSIKFPQISQITGPTPIEPASTISAAFKKNHARFNSNNQVNGKHRVYLQNQQSPTPESNRPVVVVTTHHPNLVKQHSIPISSSSSPSPLIQIVESRSIRPPSQLSHENSIFPLHLNSRRPNSVVSDNTVPITVFPNDTVLIQYHTTLEKLNTDPKSKPGKRKFNGKRRERATFNTGFEERINLLSCKDEAEVLIREILESPLRKRNALLGILRMKDKEKERKGKESSQAQQSKQNNNFGTNFQQSSVAANLNSFTNQQQQVPTRSQNVRKQNDGGRKTKQVQQSTNGQFISNNIRNNQVQNQAQFNNQVGRGNNRNKQNNQNFQVNNAGQQSNRQQPLNNRNNQNQQAQRFGGRTAGQEATQSTSPSFSIVRTTPVTSTRRPITTTIRTTRQPKNVLINNQRTPQQPQQRAIPSVNTIPAKITVNEQFQHFPGFQQHSAKKNKQPSQNSNDNKSLKGSFKQPTLKNSNFEQAFLTKIPAKQVQTQENKRQKQVQKQAEKQAQKQAQLERARKRLQKQQQQQQKLKTQNNIVGINGKPLNQQQQKKTPPNTIQPPKFFIDVPKKSLNGQFQSQNTNQGNALPRKQKTINKKPVFLPGEFTEVVNTPPTQGTFNRQNQANNRFNNNNRANLKPNNRINSNPNRKEQSRKNSNNGRNNTPRQNFSSDAKQFNNNVLKQNRQPKTVNQNPIQNQILTTSRPQVTQTFVPRQILSGNNKGTQENQSTNDGSGESSKGGNTFTIEQFLQRYPEVKRLSSRFGDDKNVQNRVVGNGQQNNKSNQNGRKKSGRKEKKKNSRRNKNNRNKNKQQKAQQNQVRQQKAINRLPPSNPQKQNNFVASTPQPIVTTRTTRRPIVTTVTTRRPIVTTTFAPATPAPRNILRQQKQSQPSIQNPRGQQSPSKPNQISPNENSVPDVDFPDDELSSVDYSYLYYQDYYEELVPVHHRFNQLATTTSTRAPSRRPNNQRKKKNKKNKNKNKKNKGGRQGKRNQLQSGNGNNKNKQPQSNSFSFFTFQPQDGEKKKGGNQGNFPNFPSNGGNNKNAIQKQKAKVVPSRKPVTQPPQPPKPKFALKPSKVGEPKAKPVAVVSKNPLQSGPYGYVDKGTFFTDSHVKGFPEMIEVVYQGFVWAMNLYYPDKQKEKHGGVHTILKDKVKRQKIFFKDGDYIVRVSGRASPYNINRLTFYTAKGKKYGPWGDRRSKDSVDFDVSAPPGHGLQYFSGTVDFGVPFRSISFHWSPHE